MLENMLIYSIIKRACISKIQEKIVYDFIPYISKDENLEGEYPQFIEIGATDFEHFFLKHINLAFPYYCEVEKQTLTGIDHTSDNYIPKKLWGKIIDLIEEDLINHEDAYRIFVEEMCTWLKIKLEKASGINIYGNL